MDVGRPRRPPFVHDKDAQKPTTLTRVIHIPAAHLSRSLLNLKIWQMLMFSL
jgi:hypothetical protein